MFHDIERKILARLEDKIPANVKVLSLAELAEVPDMRQKAPAVFLVYEGYEPASVTANVPHIQQIEQSFTAVVAAKNARGAGKVDVAKAEASEIGQAVLEALLGFQVSPGVRLKLSAAPGPEYDGGFCYLPVAFSCRSTFKGEAG